MATAEEFKSFDCEAGALEGIRFVLHGQLGEMCDLRAAALEWEDIEGVHRMRVASRRLRSALRDFEEFLDSRGIPQRRLREVAGALGEVRDQDVAIVALEEVRSKAGGDVAEGIEQFINERSARRVHARARLQPVIAGASLSELQQKFILRLKRAGGGVRRKKEGKRVRSTTKVVSFRQAGRQVIESRLAELHQLSNSLHHPFDVEPLHRMRIAAKRLRYALELFAPCWGGRLSSCSREVAELQTALGELRDCDIWIADLGARLDRHRDEAEGTDEQIANSQIRQAAIWLLNHFTKERGKYFRRALARWHKWETGGFFGRMSELLEDAQAAKSDVTASRPEVGWRGL
jgi:CHAD domain-containing protein